MTNKFLVFFRSHFYKILLTLMLAMMLTQYGLNIFFYQTSVFFFNITATRNLISYTMGTLLPGTNTSNLTLQRSEKSSQTNLTTYLLRENVALGGKSAIELSINQLVRNLSQKAFLDGATNQRLVSIKSVVLPAKNSSSWYNRTNKIIANNVDVGQRLKVDGLSVPRANGTTAKNLTICPVVPPKLVGAVRVWKDAPAMGALEMMYKNLELGGRSRPADCQSRYKVAIVIPYRDRELHLRMFLHNMHPILQRQQLDYGIFVVEQAGKGKFNRAKLMNIGFVEAMKLYDWQCFIFHDVDLLPEDDRNMYSCPDQPRHMSVAIDSMNYRLPYSSIFGGVGALTTGHFQRVNGFSNEFWGWGGEDDDMSNRLKSSGLQIIRYPNKIARYKMMRHNKDQPNPDRYNKLYKGHRRFKTDGLNSLVYKRIDLLLKRLYTWVLVDVGNNKV